MKKQNESRLKVMHILGAAGPGGAETFFIRLVTALNDGDTGVEVLPVVKRGSWASEQLKKLNIDFREAEFGGFFDFQTKRLLRDYIKGFKPDVIQSWMSRATKFLPKTDIPTVARLGGYYSLKYYRNRVQHLIGNTQDICDYLTKAGWDKEHVHYIPNFTEPPLTGFKEQKNLVRDRYNIPHQAYVILLAGRLHECKGFDLIFYVLRYLPKHVHILVAGTGAQRDALAAVADADGLSNRVHFIGWVNQISPLAAAADTWAIPSRIEPLGNTVLDAWAHSLPIVASRAIGPKTLINNGTDGLLFDIDDADGAQAALLRLIEERDLGGKLAQAGSEKLQSQFSMEIVLGQYLTFYKNIAQEG